MRRPMMLHPGLMIVVLESRGSSYTTAAGSPM
jgi:hypothetical protein